MKRLDGKTFICLFCKKVLQRGYEFNVIKGLERIVVEKCCRNCYKNYCQGKPMKKPPEHS